MDKTTHLMRRVRDNRAERARTQAVTQWHEEQRRLVEDSPSRQVMDFWCDHSKCKKDFIAMAHKRRNWGFNLDTNTAYEVFPLRAWYVGKCERGHEVLRHITDKSRDPYFYLSERLKRERYEAGDDLLQPSDPRFRIKYPKQWEQIEAEREEVRAKQEYENAILNGSFT